MSANESLQSDSRKHAVIIVAIIGLLGTITTAVISNWDKMFHNRGIITAAYSGYRPTGDYETELRYLMEVSGTRKGLEAFQQQFLRAFEIKLITDHPEAAKEIKTMTGILAEEIMSVDDVMKVLLPVYQKHFTLEQIQDLNKLHSTEAMQAMNAKGPLIMQDTMPQIMAAMEVAQKRVGKRLQQELQQPPENEHNKPN